MHPRSRGNLSLPGEYSTDSRPPAHEVKITGTDPDSHSVRTEQHSLSRPVRSFQTKNNAKQLI